MTSGCMGEIHLPARSASMTLPPAAICDRTTARTNMPGFSAPSELAALTRMRTVRVRSVSTGSMNEIIPRNVRPGSDSVVNSTFCPYRSHARSDS